MAVRAQGGGCDTSAAPEHPACGSLWPWMRQRGYEVVVFVEHEGTLIDHAATRGGMGGNTGHGCRAR